MNVFAKVNAPMLALVVGISVPFPAGTAASASDHANVEGRQERADGFSQNCIGVIAPEAVQGQVTVNVRVGGAVVPNECSSIREPIEAEAGD